MACPVPDLPANHGSDLVQRILFSLWTIVAEGVLPFMSTFHRFGVIPRNIHLKQPQKGIDMIRENHEETFMSQSRCLGHVWARSRCAGESAACIPRSLRSPHLS